MDLSAKFPKIETLVLARRTPRLPAPWPMAFNSLKSLRTLQLYFYGIKDLNSTGSLRNLTRLKLVGCDPPVPQAQLEYWDSLRHLKIRYNLASDGIQSVAPDPKVAQLGPFIACAPNLLSLSVPYDGANLLPSDPFSKHQYLHRLGFNHTYNNQLPVFFMQTQLWQKVRPTFILFNNVTSLRLKWAPTLHELEGIAACFRRLKFLKISCPEIYNRRRDFDFTPLDELYSLIEISVVGMDPTFSTCVFNHPRASVKWLH
jgi:hypothetical protein